jgi:hypothetical protein
MPKFIELPPAVARRFVEDMRAFHAEPNAIKRDEIAARQLHGLKQHYAGKLRLSDVKEMFELMWDHTWSCIRQFCLHCLFVVDPNRPEAAHHRLVVAALSWISQLGRNQPDILAQLRLSIIDLDLEHRETSL